MISQIKTLWKLVSGEIKDVFDAIAINTTTRQVKTGSHEINSSVERGSAGEEYDLLQYASDSTATHDQFAIKGVVPTTQDYAEAWGGEDATGQWGKGFILKHDKTNKKFKFQYSTSGKNDGTETDIMSLADSGAIDLGSNNLTTTGTLSSGGETIVKNALGTTSTDGQVITNNTLAVIGTTVQIPARNRSRGNALNTTSGLSETVDCIQELLPVSGASVLGTYRIGFSINGGAYSYPMTLESGGLLSVARLGVATGSDVFSANSSTQARIQFNSTGLVLSRNVANANPVSIINNIHASSTGNICDFQWQSVNRASISREGKIWSTSAYYGEMYIYENSTAETVDTNDVYKAVRNFSTGLVDGFTFGAGSTGAITAFADYSGTVAGTVLVTDVGHGLATGNIVTILGTTNYNGTFAITKVTDDTFYITVAWVADDATGNWYQPSYLKANTGSAGVYKIQWNITADSATNGEHYKVEANQNVTPLDNIASERNFGTGTDYGVMTASGLVNVADGDYLWLSFKQTSAGNDDFTILHANFNINRM
jgi:hypothetical protein